MIEGVLFAYLCVTVPADSARNMCYEFIRAGAQAVIGWIGLQFQMLWTTRMIGMRGSYLTLPTHLPPL